MSASEIPSGAIVALDANVFIYHFTGQSEQAIELLMRIDAGDVGGVTTHGVLAEVMHRRMMLEALERGVIPRGNPAARLRRNPDVVQKLTQSHHDVAGLYSIGLRVYAPHPRALLDSFFFQRTYGLLTNDALLAAVLVHHGVTTLVTADRDFLPVNELETFLLDDVSS